MLSNLFDKSYLHPPAIDFTDPYLSPTTTSDTLLKDAYPDDMLNVEGFAFGERLSISSFGEIVKGDLIIEAPHAFDKKLNLVRFPKAADRCYAETVQN
jgi:hypothetical protein